MTPSGKAEYIILCCEVAVCSRSQDLIEESSRNPMEPRDYGIVLLRDGLISNQNRTQQLYYVTFL